MLEVDDDPVQIDDLGLEHLLAPEREQLPRQTGSTLGRTERLLDLTTRVLATPGLPERQLPVAADRGQEVVEVVRDAAGESTDCFELLRLVKLLLEPHTLRHVHHRSD